MTNLTTCLDLSLSSRSTNANWAGALHFVGVGMAGMIFASETFGDGLTIRAVRKLEIATPEKVSLLCIGIASVIALLLFASRESEKPVDSYDRWLRLLFTATWAFAGITIATNIKKDRHVHHVSTRAEKYRRRMSGATPTTPDTSNRDGSSVSSNRAKNTKLPIFWHFLLISISMFTFVGPVLYWTMIREGVDNATWRGASGGVSVIVLVAHFLMTTHAPCYMIVHMLIHLLGEGLTTLIFFREHNSRDALSACVVESLFYFVVVGLAICTRQSLSKWGLQLEMSASTFRWLFASGGLLMGLYIHFESIGCTLDPNVSWDGECEPWVLANKTVAIQAALSAAVSATIIADSRCKMKHVVRNQTPCHVTALVSIMMLNSALSCILFAGREFAGSRHVAFYRVIYDVFLMAWSVALVIGWYGHTAWRSRQVEHQQRNRIDRESGNTDRQSDGGVFGAAGGHVTVF